jgi:hypothetical protein
MRTNMNTKDLLKAVSELNLDPIKTKLMHVPSGEGWSRAKTDAVEKEYRRFLVLMKLYPNEDTAPLVDVDTFWHYHILDTMKYASDCEQALGGFLHHYPYVGLRGEADQQFRVDSGDRMRALYEATFNEAYPGSRTPAAQAARNLALIADPYYERQPAVTLQANADTAWCAGPGGHTIDGPVTTFGKLAASAEGAVNGTAWCAGPGGHIGDGSMSAIGKLAAGAEGAVSGGTAWCAGPGGHIGDGGMSSIGKLAASAEGAVSGGTAWCAGPGGHPDKVKAQAGGGTAWCAGPGGHTVAAPGKSARTGTLCPVGGETAWCASPHDQMVSGNGRTVH